MIKAEDFDSPDPQRPGRAATLITALCWAYALTIIGLSLLLRMAGDRWWPATLLLFSPRWIWLVPCVPLALLVAALRPRRLWVPLATAALVLLCIMNFCIPWRAMRSRDSTAPAIRVLTCNLHRTQANLAVLDGFIAENQPDVIALQDFTSRRTPSCLTQGTWYVQRDDQFLVASRYPLRKRGDIPLRDFRPDGLPEPLFPAIGAAVCYDLELPTGPVRFVNLHLGSPHKALEALRDEHQNVPQWLTANSVRRWHESLIVSGEVRRLSGPVILAGDFNTPADSPIFRDAWSSFGDAFSTAGFGVGTTYAKHHTGMRIDHILFDAHWSCRSCRVGPDVGSGHRPVVAELRFCPGPG